MVERPAGPDLHGRPGSLALGGTLAALALFTNTQLLLAVLGGLYVVETLSVILQVASFRLFQRQVFKMAPIHLHFELSEWPGPDRPLLDPGRAGRRLRTGLFYAGIPGREAAPVAGPAPPTARPRPGRRAVRPGGSPGCRCWWPASAAPAEPPPATWPRAGADVVACDDAPDLDTGDLAAFGVKTLGPAGPARLDGRALLVVAPGLPEAHPLIQAARLVGDPGLERDRAVHPGAPACRWSG